MPDLHGIRVLWLDNDPPQIGSYVEALRERGALVEVTSTVSSGEERLLQFKPDLVIIDVMVPTKSAEEEVAYSPALTDRGYRTGFVFFRRLQQICRDFQPRVLVMTVRLDKKIEEDFRNLGLPERSFATKLALREVPIFIERVEEVLDG